jgi:hypothetical protein
MKHLLLITAVISSGTAHRLCHTHPARVIELEYGNLGVKMLMVLKTALIIQRISKLNTKAELATNTASQN